MITDLEHYLFSLAGGPADKDVAGAGTGDTLTLKVVIYGCGYSPVVDRVDAGIGVLPCRVDHMQIDIALGLGDV